MISRQSRIGASLGILAVGLAVGLPGCGSDESSNNGESAKRTSSAVRATALDQLLNDAPAARVLQTANRPGRVFGTRLAGAATADAAAEAFRSKYAAAFGVDPDELRPLVPGQGPAAAASAAKPIGLMYDRKTGQYKFWLYRYGHARAGIRVFRSELKTLVRNEPGNPVVWAGANLRDLGNFRPPSTAKSFRVDADKSLRAVRATSDLSG